jgi:glycosyltransferase involved in cell wall biosynthesis
MKLAIHNGSRVWGGNERWIANLAVALRDRGHDIVVSCRAEGPLSDYLQRNGIATSPIRPGGDIDLRGAMRFARWLAKEQPDTLLLTSWNRTPWAVWAARRAHVPRVVVRLGIVRSLPRRGRYTRAFRAGVDALIVNSAEIKAEWVRSAPWFPADAVHVIFNGIAPVPTSHVSVALRERAGVATDALSRSSDEFRRGLGVEPDVHLIVAAGHLTRRKGFDVLLSALAEMAATGVHVVIVGSGPEEERLHAQAAALGVTARVHWLGERADVLDVFACCDAFALSSRNEGMANVMLEAMAVGLPVVATRVSGVRDALDEVRGRPPAGWIVPPEDPAALAAALEHVLAAVRSEPDVVRARVAEAEFRIRHWFSIPRMAEDAERVIFHPVGCAQRYRDSSSAR